MNKLSKPFYGLALGAFLLLGWAPASMATMLVFELDIEYSSGDPPEGGTPWVTITIDDGGTSGSVTLTISNSGLVGAEINTGTYLNLNPDLDASMLTIVNSSGTAATGLTSSTNAFMADGDGSFDILIAFDTSVVSFGAGETSVILISGLSILASDFNFLSLGAGNSKDGLFSAAHIQRIGPGSDDSGSGWITGGVSEVPEPATLSLLGLGLIGFGLSRRRRRVT